MSVLRWCYYFKGILSHSPWSRRSSNASSFSCGMIDWLFGISEAEGMNNLTRIVYLSTIVLWIYLCGKSYILLYKSHINTLNEVVFWHEAGWWMRFQGRHHQHDTRDPHCSICSLIVIDRRKANLSSILILDSIKRTYLNVVAFNLLEYRTPSKAIHQ